MIRTINLGTRLTLGFGVLALLILIQGLIALDKMSDMHESQDEISDNWLPSIMAIANLRYTITRYRIFALRVLIDTSASERASTRATLAGVQQDLDKAVEKYASLISEDEERTIFNRLIADQKRYVANVQKIITLMDSGSLDDAKAMVEQQQTPLAEKMAKDMVALFQINSAGASASSKPLPLSSP